MTTTWDANRILGHSQLVGQKLLWGQVDMDVGLLGDALPSPYDLHLLIQKGRTVVSIRDSTSGAEPLEVVQLYNVAEIF